MLTELYIKDFTIIETAHVALNAGMTVLTGETGAGKSILMDALGLALGNRADISWIRHGCEYAEIIATFQINQASRAYAWCEANDIIHNTQEPLILRRVMYQNGRTKAHINGRPTTIQQLKSLGQFLVHIHSQNEHHALLSTATQLNRLDHYAKHPSLLADIKKNYDQWHTATIAYQNALNAQSANSAEKDLLQYQVAELDDFSLGETEAAELIKTHQQLTHAQDLIAASGESLSRLKDNPEHSVLSELNGICQKLEIQTQVDPTLSNIVTMLNEASINIEEAATELSLYHNNFTHDPTTLQQAEVRLNQLNTLAHKHHVEPEALYQQHQALINKLKALDTTQADLDTLQKTIKAADKAYQTASQKLSQSRQNAAKALATEITQTMQTLNMEGGQCKIILNTHLDKTPTPKGDESCQFHVSTNPGQPLKPMQSVVSGGELSRISLAIQVLTAAQSPTPTLIFDEVDVGIGGGTAEIVGQLLRQLGEHCQVLCVTHLPQVAARGHQHIKIHKTKTATQTQTGLTHLNQENRIEEIARMLGGVKIQSETIQHAKAMLANT